MTRKTDTPPALDERTQLATFLDYARDTARAKCEGVSAEDARRAPVATSPLMTLCGLISHLRWVEYHWFQVMFLGEEPAGLLTQATEEDPDPEMRTAVDVPLPQLLAEYEEQSARYRRLVAEHELDEPTARPRRDGGGWTCGGCCSISSRRRRGTTGTSTSCASCWTGSGATSGGTSATPGGGTSRCPVRRRAARPHDRPDRPRRPGRSDVPPPHPLRLTHAVRPAPGGAVRRTPAAP